MGTKLVLDCSTGTASVVPQTQAEIAQAAADASAGVASEQAAATITAKATTIRTNLAAQIAPGSPARNAITTNTTFVGIASPTNAQVVAQIKALSNQNNVIIPAILRLARLALSQLDADA